MAKFRNIDKRRRLWETKEQKRKRSLWEAGIILQHRTDRMLARYCIKPAAQSQAERANFDALEEYYSAHPVVTVQVPAVLMKRRCALDPPVLLDGSEVEVRQLVGVAPKAVGVFTDSELLLRYLSRQIFRLRRWLQNFWAAARFTHPAAWLLEGQNRARPQ